MSNISTLEPQTHGLILFKTTFGQLEIELFTKQCPKISKNFVQLCLDDYYQDTIFDRVERDFIAIGGKWPTTTAMGDGDLKEIKETYPDEFHSRLKFSRRGLMATANTEKDANGAEFFFTLGTTPELQNKHSIFGRLKGNSVYCLVDLNECPVDDDMVPISEKKILEVIVVENPFPDLQPRTKLQDKLRILRANPRPQDDHDGDDDNNYRLEPKFDIKSSKKLSFYPSDDESGDVDTREKASACNESTTPKSQLSTLASTINDLNQDLPPPSRRSTSPSATDHRPQQPDDSRNKEDWPSEDARARRLGEIREQITNIKTQFELASATKIRTLADRRRLSQDQDSSLGESMRSNSLKQSNIEDPDLAAQEYRLAAKKARHRERETLDMLDNFKEKMSENRAAKSKDKATIAQPERMSATLFDEDDEAELAETLAFADSDAWLRHKFEADSGDRLAKDANQKGDDWYSIDDPRNPLVKGVEADKAREYKTHYSSSSSSSRRHATSHHDRRSKSPSPSSSSSSYHRDSRHEHHRR